MKLNLSLLVGSLISLLATINLYAFDYPAPAISIYTNEENLIHIDYSGTPVDLWEYEYSYDGITWANFDEQGGDANDTDYYFIGAEIRIYGASYNLENQYVQLTPYSNIFLFNGHGDLTNAIPIMTDYTTDDVTMDASTETPTYLAYGHSWQAGDRNNLGYWESNSTNLPNWLRIHFPTAQNITEYSIICGLDDFYNFNDGNIALSPKDFQLQGSNDGTTWAALNTQTNVTWPTSLTSENNGIITNTFTIDMSTPFSWYRIYITASYSGEDESHIIENGTVIFGWELLNPSPNPTLKANPDGTIQWSWIGVSPSIWRIETSSDGISGWTFAKNVSGFSRTTTNASGNYVRVIAQDGNRVNLTAYSNIIGNN